MEALKIAKKYVIMLFLCTLAVAGCSSTPDTSSSASTAAQDSFELDEAASNVATPEPTPAMDAPDTAQPAVQPSPGDDFTFDNVKDPAEPQSASKPRRKKKALKKAVADKKLLPFCKKLVIADQVCPVCLSHAPKGACFCLATPGCGGR